MSRDHAYAYASSRPTVLVDPEGLLPLPGILSRLPGCVADVYSEVRSLGEAEQGWRYAHCVGACRLRKMCGLSPQTVRVLGWFKEIQQDFECSAGLLATSVPSKDFRCHTAVAPRDHEDNETGFTCRAGEPCEKRCSPLLGRNKEMGELGWLYPRGRK